MTPSGWHRLYIPLFTAPVREESDHFSVESEAWSFYRLWLDGQDYERLRADIAPGRMSPAMNRTKRLATLARFEELVERERSRRAA